MTTKIVNQIEQLAREGWCGSEISRRLNIPGSTVRRFIQDAGIPAGKKGHAGFASKEKYTFYLRSTGEYLCEGTTEECAAALGLKPGSVHTIIHLNRNAKSKKYVIRKSDEEKLDIERCINCEKQDCDNCIGREPKRKARECDLKRYTVYDGMTTQYLVEGTAEECAKYLGWKTETFRTNKTKFSQGDYKKYEIYEVEE